MKSVQFFLLHSHNWNPIVPRRPNGSIPGLVWAREQGKRRELDEKTGSSNGERAVCLFLRVSPQSLHLWYPPVSPSFFLSSNSQELAMEHSLDSPCSLAWSNRRESRANGESRAVSRFTVISSRFEKAREWGEWRESREPVPFSFRFFTLDWNRSHRISSRGIRATLSPFGVLSRRLEKEREQAKRGDWEHDSGIREIVGTSQSCVISMGLGKGTECGNWRETGEDWRRKGGMEWKEKDLSAPEIGEAIFFLLPCLLGSAIFFFYFSLFVFVCLEKLMWRYCWVSDQVVLMKVLKPRLYWSYN